MDDKELISRLILEAIQKYEAAKTENKQERVVSEENDDSLLELDPLTPLPADSLDNSESLSDAQEELVEEDEVPDNFVRPELKKDNSLMEEVLDEGDSQKGNRQCLRVPFSTAPRKNRFKDNPAFAKVDTLSFDKKVRTEDSIKSHQFIEKRPPATKVIVRCRECNRRFKIDSKLAPQRLDREDNSTYQCDGCILRRKG